MEVAQKLEVDIAVIIPFYNDAERLQICIEALQKQSIEKTFHIIAVDNGSDYHPAQLADIYSNLTLLIETRPGSYSARNKALDFVTAKIYAFTDADCIPSEDWLKNVVDKMSYSKADAVGGGINVFCENPDTPTAIEVIDLIKAFPQKSYVEQHHFAVTANLTFSHEALVKVGKFNANLKSGGDKDWCLRLHTAGGNLVFEGAALVWHPARASLSEHKTKMRRLAHGAYTRRKGDAISAKYVGLHGIVMGLMPPIRKAQLIWKRFSMISTTERCAAILYYWYINSYASIQKIRCHLKLVKEAERN